MAWVSRWLQSSAARFELEFWNLLLCPSFDELGAEVVSAPLNHTHRHCLPERSNSDAPKHSKYNNQNRKDALTCTAVRAANPQPERWHLQGSQWVAPSAGSTCADKSPAQQTKFTRNPSAWSWSGSSTWSSCWVCQAKHSIHRSLSDRHGNSSPILQSV